MEVKVVTGANLGDEGKGLVSSLTAVPNVLTLLAEKFSIVLAQVLWWAPTPFIMNVLFLTL